MAATSPTRAGLAPARARLAVSGLALLVALVGLLALLGPQRLAHAQLNCNVGIEFYPGGGIRSCVLNGHHRLHLEGGQVVICADSQRLGQYPDGRLRSCILQAPLTAGALTCAAGSRVEFGPAGMLTGCEAPRAPTQGDDPWHYRLGEERPAQQASLCRDRRVALEVARVFVEKGPRAGYAALEASGACTARVASVTPRAVVAEVAIAAGAGEGYTVRFVEVTTATGTVEYLFTTREVRP